MTISKTNYKKILDTIKLGNSVAENDFLLESARVETHAYVGVLNDTYELVMGRKGAGKTAIYKMINSIAPSLLAQSNVVVLSGVNPQGEPIFNLFKNEFKDYSEEDFENFWKLYFIALIHQEFLIEEMYQSGLTSVLGEIKRFESECSKAGIPNFPKKIERKQIIAWIMTKFPPLKKIKMPVGYNTQTNTLFAMPELEFGEKVLIKQETERRSLYVNSIGLVLKEILARSGFKVWIILDRLDEVFERYSSVEFKGLRGLLKAYKSFDVGEDNDLFRIKIFLRDDIKDFLTDDRIYKKYFGSRKTIPPLPAATHIFAKQSPTLAWTEDEVEQLILNRLLSSQELRSLIGITEKYKGLGDEELNMKLKEEMKNKTNRVLYWEKIFSPIAGNSSLKWIFAHLKDSNDVVTARSVIDFLEGALGHQKRKLQLNFQDEEYIFPADALKKGIEFASKNKLEHDIYVEFPKEQNSIRKLANEGQYKLTVKMLRKLYGQEWEEITQTLSRIGILKYIKNSGDYRVMYLFRPALGINYMY